jgi:hypothetical protein
MNTPNTSETPTPETTAAPARKRRARAKDIAGLCEQIDRHSSRHMRMHDQLLRLAVTLMELSSDAKNGYEEAFEVRRNLRLTAPTQ